MRSETVYQVQLALKASGFDPGLPDGIWGPKTRAALQAWQAVNRRPHSDVLLPTDIGLLLKVSAPSEPEILWIVEAQRLLGLKEGKGKLDNPIILSWDDKFDISYPHDDIPWCGLFLAHTMRTALPNEPLPTNILGARNWTKFGVKVQPQDGAVGVFWRGSPSGWEGHVGYLVGQSADAYTVLGGNQSDSVSYTSIAKSRLLGAYWPSTVGPAPNLPLPPKPQLRLSTNEA